MSDSPAGLPRQASPRGVSATDLYEVNMALAYLRSGRTAPATFSLFARKVPAERGFLVSAGLADVLEFLERFEIGPDELAEFADALGRPVAELRPLAGLRFSGDVWAVPEGRLVFANEPLLEVTAPLPQAQLIETWVLNQINYQTTLAAKAARCVLAAGPTPVVDFSLRRTHGIEAGMHAARAAGIVGFAGTSNVAAAVRYGIAASGTMAHSFVQAFDGETTAFRAFADTTRGPVILLVDTYDTEQGVEHAAEILRTMPAERAIGVRLDSGDLAELAMTARHILDRHGLGRARIIASGGLDEYHIEALKTAGAPIDMFAVGTKVGTSADAPYLDAAYKLVEYAGQPVMKLSTGKLTLPGAKQVFRRDEPADLLALRTEPPPTHGRPLLELVMRGGRRQQSHEPPAAQVLHAHQRFAADLAWLPATARRIHEPQRPVPTLSAHLSALTHQLQQQLTAALRPPPISRR